MSTIDSGLGTLGQSLNTSNNDTIYIDDSANLH
jgi:hypothetical protein